MCGLLRCWWTVPSNSDRLELDFRVDLLTRQEQGDVAVVEDVERDIPSSAVNSADSPCLKWLADSGEHEELPRPAVGLLDFESIVDLDSGYHEFFPGPKTYSS